jgi:hypothetical protein
MPAPKCDGGKDSWHGWRERVTQAAEPPETGAERLAAEPPGTEAEWLLSSPVLLAVYSDGYGGSYLPIELKPFKK